MLSQQQGCAYLGKYGCKGYNTYGPWRLIGGMNKGHPSQAEISEAMEFYEKVMERFQEI